MTPTRWLNRTVAGAGVASALGDFSDEATTAILPGLPTMSLMKSILVNPSPFQPRLTDWTASGGNFL